MFRSTEHKTVLVLCSGRQNIPQEDQGKGAIWNYKIRVVASHLPLCYRQKSARKRMNLRTLANLWFRYGSLRGTKCRWQKSLTQAKSCISMSSISGQTSGPRGLCFMGSTLVRVRERIMFTVNVHWRTVSGESCPRHLLFWTPIALIIRRRKSWIHQINGGSRREATSPNLR